VDAGITAASQNQSSVNASVFAMRVRLARSHRTSRRKRPSDYSTRRSALIINAVERDMKKGGNLGDKVMLTVACVLGKPNFDYASARF
jgi:hypothetical protein